MENTSDPLLILALLALTAGCGGQRPPAVPQPFPGTAPRSASPARAAAAADIVSSAKAQLGVRYRPGGDEPSAGFDCSGLVRYVFAEHHIALPRTVAEQFGQGVRVQARDFQPGDLVFFKIEGPGASHVGIVIGDGQFIHAPASNGVVRIEHYDTPYWHDRIVGGRRPSAKR